MGTTRNPDPRRGWWAGGLAGVLCLVLALPCAATPEQASKIPPTDLGCTLCHSGPSATVDYVPPGGSESLTSFGDQWLQLSSDPEGRTWSAMALLNADTDGCSNGYELGDATGSYPGGQLESRSLNPSAPDCTLPLDEKTWGNLKSLFEQ